MKQLAEQKKDSYEQKVGIEIVQKAIRQPLKIIADNSGYEGAVVVEKVLSYDNPQMGFEPKYGDYRDLVKEGVIDPLKVVRTALVNSASVASLMITSEAMVVDIPKKECKFQVIK